MLDAVVFGSFFGEVGHFLFDDAGVDPVVARGQHSPSDVRDHAPIERRQAFHGSGAKKRSRFPQNPHGVNEAQSARIDVHRNGGFVHEEPDGVVGRRDAVDFL